MASEVTASLLPINPNTLFFDGYELTDQSIIPNENITSAFVPFQDKVEYWVYDLNKTLIDGTFDFSDYIVPQSPSNSTENDSTELELSPVEDAYNLGYETGKLYTVYNFIRYHLGSSPETRYYLAEISSDRTEVRLKSNLISDEEIGATFAQLKTELNSNEYFDEFYLNFGENQYSIGVNLELDLTGETYSVLVKLYDALPSDFNVKDEVFVVTKVAESTGYQIEYPDIIDLPSDVNFLRGPNTNLEIKDFVNNSTELKSRDELVNTQSSSSKDNLANILNRKGVTISPNYSYNTFNEFVNFSSAKKRIENFVEKVEQIQAYESDIDALVTITGSTSASYEVSSSIASAYTNIENLIKNFDGYEYFLYYNTGSSSYPKTGSAFPYTLLPTTDPTVTQWLGSDVEGSQYYGGILLSASRYDNNNQNWLYYTIPEFIRSNENNDQYLEFSNMVGQHFDEIWLYTKAVSEKNNTTSDLNSGIPLQLADDAISSLGYSGFGNNYNNEDNFIGLTGEDNGSYVPPTGSELINHYIAVNGGSIVNYWSDYYSYQFYVESIEDPGWPYAIDRVSKEIFKRLYHNMSYLVKKKGTISGLRQLINIWGIPNTILRINEFGGKNKDNSDDYDLWYNRYSYAFSPISTQHMPSASVVFPWMPLERNRLADGEYIVPDSFQFRFKTTGIPTSSFAGDFFTQSLAVKKSDGDDTSTDFDFGIALFYTGSTSGSYLGSSSSEYENWGNMRFYISGSAADGGVAVSDDVYLPFFDKGWWSVMLQRNTHVSASDNSNATTYTLYVKNKTYNGWDGNSIGFEGSASIVSNVSTSINEAWNKFGTGSADGIYLGGFVSGSNVGGVTLNTPGKMLSGSLQEFRYYSNPLPELKFNDFVMNPESIEGINLTGSLSSFDMLNFRAPLGNEMESIFTSSLSSSYSEAMTSMHPAITGSANLLITGSFVNPVGNVTSSAYNVLYYENSTTKTFSKTNTEVYFLDQPAIGLRNRISNKIQIEDGSDYGNTLSSLISIEQDYQISRSYTEDVNSLEVAFSPQEEVNDDIIATFGYGVVADALADPRFISESLDYYPQLRRTAEDYFQKYTKGNVYDYLRLIKYFDNSIFKAIKNYVPARTSVTTGIVIKQHLLERNRYPQPKLNEVTTIARYASGSGANITYNNPINLENLELTSSLAIGSVEGGAGGSVNKYNIPAGLLRLQDNDPSSTYTLTSGSAITAFTHPDYSFIDNRTTFLEVSSSIVGAGYGFPNPTDGVFTNITDYDFVGDVQFSIFNTPGSAANITINIVEVGIGVVASKTTTFPSAATTYARGDEFNNFRFKANTSYYITMTSDTTVTVRRLQLTFENNPKAFWTGQIYNNYNDTVVGLLTDIDQREEEFYDGEYSGSEVAATTQSLFNNPFLELSTTETVYSASVVYTGLTPYTKGNPNSTTFDLRWGTPNFSTVQTHVQNSMTNTTTSVVWVNTGSEGPDAWYVTALALAQSDNYGGSWPSFLNDHKDSSYILYPPPAYSQYVWGDDESRDKIPYFTFCLPNNTGGYESDVESEGLSFQVITSFGLSLNKNELPQQGSDVNNFSTIKTRIWTFATSSDQNPSRPILLSNGTTYPLTPQVYSYTSGIPFASIQLIPSSQVISSLNSIPSVTTGQAKLGFAGTTYYATSSEGIDYLIPAYLRIHNEDNNGNFNSPSFKLKPDLSIPLTATGSLRNDGTGVKTSTFDTSLLSGYISENFNQNGLYNTYKYSDASSIILNRPNTVVGNNDISLVSFDPFVDPNSTIVFENSDYNAVINNYNDNRDNTFVMNVEYENGINTPSNLSLIKNRTAEKTQTPDSNYTSKKVTKPRYEGVKLQSADYNFYTAGDISYGKTAVVDKNPIYFAHFKSSKENYELWDSYTFRIDSLIEVPQGDVRGENIEPKTLKIDGSNDKLAEVVSTFEKGRGATVSYNLGKTDNIDYTALKIGSSVIFQGGLEYNLILGTAKDKQVSNYTQTQSFVSSSWLTYGYFKTGSTYTQTSNVTFATASDIYGVGGVQHWAETGSGVIILKGGGFGITGSTGGATPEIMSLMGPGLGVIHSMNKAVEYQIEASNQSLFNPNTYNPGIPQDSTIDPDVSSNYWSLSPTGSGLYGYEDFQQPFLIKRGDEIRVTWEKDTTFPGDPQTVDFTVTNTPNAPSNNSQYKYFQGLGVGTVNSRSIYDHIEVTPNPSSYNIPNGKIYNMTIRRRVEADDRVIVFQTPPSGSQGIRTITKDGYLIPNDLTTTQKRNVQTLINQLKSKNAFRDDNTDTPTV